MSSYILDDEELAFIPNEFKKMVEKEIEMAELKDSGERKIFESGAMRDISEGKGRCDLLPLDTVAYIFNPFICINDPDVNELDILELVNNFLRTQEAEYLKKAILKFAKANDWDLPTMVLEVAIQYEDGARKYEENNWKIGMPVHNFIDSAIRHYLKWLRGDKDEPHNRAFIWNLVCAIWIIKNKPEFNDIIGY